MARAPLAVDKDQMRMLVLDVGAAEAQRMTGVNGNTIRQWISRYGWLDHLKPQNAPKVPKSMQPQIVTNVTQPVDAVLKKQQQEATETRSNLSTSLATLSEQAKNATLADARNVHEVVKAASTLHGWNNPQESGSVTNLLSVTLNYGETGGGEKQAEVTEV